MYVPLLGAVPQSYQSCALAGLQARGSLSADMDSGAVRWRASRDALGAQMGSELCASRPLGVLRVHPGAWAGALAGLQEYCDTAA